MFNYYFINNNNIATTINIGYNTELQYLKSLIIQGKYKELVITKRFF